VRKFIQTYLDKRRHKLLQEVSVTQQGRPVTVCAPQHTLHKLSTSPCQRRTATASTYVWNKFTSKPLM